MEIQVDRLGAGDAELTWIDCPDLLLTMLASAKLPAAQPFSVLMTDEEIDISGEKLTLDPGQLRVALVGVPGRALLIGKRRVVRREDSGQGSALALNGDVPGDQDFLRAVDSELLNVSLRAAMRDVLGEVRRLQPGGALRSGEARKFVNYPDNFVGFTVQPRNQAVLVHIRDCQEAKRSSLKVAPDRRPYVRFWISTERDVEEALSMIRGSWRRGR